MLSNNTFWKLEFNGYLMVELLSKKDSAYTCSACSKWVGFIHWLKLKVKYLVQPRKTRPCVTERLLMGRKESTQTKTKKHSCSSSSWCGILWNTLLKSSSTALICSQSLSPFARSFTVKISCDSQERRFLKPCCASLSRRWSSRCLITWLCTMCSSILQHMDVKDTGL